MADANTAAAEDRAHTAMQMGPDWQAGRHQPRDPEVEITTPSLEEMAQAPGATHTKYCITYERVGRHGGRNGSTAPAPLTVWAVTTDSLAERIHDDVRPYLTSRWYEVSVDLEQACGRIFVGGNNGGSFTIAVLQTAEGGEPRD